MELKKLNMLVVHRVPAELEPGCLYVCFDCNVVAHLCACGCGEKVILPIDPDYWSIQYNGETVSLSPSIGNFQSPCKSHYWIKGNRVIWVDSRETKDTQIKSRTRKKNRRLMDRLKSLF